MKGSYGASLVIRAIGIWAIFLGVMILVGGEARWNNPAYQFADLMPGSPFTWGVIVLVGGLLIMYGSLTNQHLPFRPFSYRHPELVWNNNKIHLQRKLVIIDWGSEQIRNLGLIIVGGWLLLLGLAFIAAIFVVPGISFVVGSLEILLSVICVIMTKVKEPKHHASSS